jgi:hypothetical protein
MINNNQNNTNNNNFSIPMNEMVFKNQDSIRKLQLLEGRLSGGDTSQVKFPHTSPSKINNENQVNGLPSLAREASLSSTVVDSIASPSSQEFTDNFTSKVGTDANPIIILDSSNGSNHSRSNLSKPITGEKRSRSDEESRGEFLSGDSLEGRPKSPKKGEDNHNNDISPNQAGE